MPSWLSKLIAKVTDTEDYVGQHEEPAEQEDYAEADVLCPICGMLVELMQHFQRDDGQEYMTVRCLSNHYITVPPEDMDLLIVEAE